MLNFPETKRSKEATLNKDGQPLNRCFNHSRNVEKAVYGLRGILIGIVADEKLNRRELKFLEHWLEKNQELKSDGDAIDLLFLIEQILEDQIVTGEELRELSCLINDIINYMELPFAETESKINELLGVIAGIAADRVIEDKEMLALREWLSVNEELTDFWPGKVIATRIEDILEDGVITQDERDDFLQVLDEVSGLGMTETGVESGFSTDFWGKEIKPVRHIGETFCFTGKFVTGTRKNVQRIVTELGADTCNDVNGNVTYLVIGSLASRDWRFSIYGRKIERAIELHEQGHPITILKEETWLASLPE